jgi:FHA domain-containing protein
MDEPLAAALKFGFLAVLYLFLLWVARSASRDLAGTGEAGLPRGKGKAKEREGPSGQPRLQVVAAMGFEPGTEFPINGGVTLGRATGADIRVDDPFASSAHARVFPRGRFIYIEDMGSTNGTYLNGRQLKRPQQLSVSDSIRIGDTEYRYEE